MASNRPEMIQCSGLCSPLYSEKGSTTNIVGVEMVWNWLEGFRNSIVFYQTILHFHEMIGIKFPGTLIILIDRSSDTIEWRNEIIGISVVDFSNLQ